MLTERLTSWLTYGLAGFLMVYTAGHVVWAVVR